MTHHQKTLAGVAALTLTAGPGAAAQDELKIGMVNLSLCCAYFVGMDAAMKDEATALFQRDRPFHRRRGRRGAS